MSVIQPLVLLVTYDDQGTDPDTIVFEVDQIYCVHTVSVIPEFKESQ